MRTHNIVVESIGLHPRTWFFLKRRHHRARQHHRPSPQQVSRTIVIYLSRYDNITCYVAQYYDIYIYKYNINGTPLITLYYDT